jgi:hypothetical protein
MDCQLAVSEYSEYLNIERHNHHIAKFIILVYSLASVYFNRSLKYLDRLLCYCQITMVTDKGEISISLFDPL